MKMKLSEAQQGFSYCSLPSNAHWILLWYT